MKKVIYTVLFIFTMTSISAQAQTSFDEDMTALHGQIFKTCALIKSKIGHDDSKTLKSLAELKTQIAKLENEYVKNPPKEYAKDPMFASYFYQLKDVVDILSERVKRSDYKSATMNCSGFCKTFNKMHIINGTLDLTDVMFMWYSQISMTNFMINAGNTKGATMNVKKIPAIYRMVIDQKNKKNCDEFNKQFESLDKTYQLWITAVKTNNFEEAKKQAKVFGAAFPMVFKNSL
ncbi:MAG: hypothetical protein B7C24_16060 [Bacteroidetes bacterium 4572_77]|nr:MAG: hypothetical protein B7C24_16060 [Bacteroidetes bacterium 4572_77]